MIVTGVVSNCFGHLLESGQSMEQLLARTESFGLTRVEMRHGSLGTTADHNGYFDPDCLHRFGRRFESLDLTPAVGLGCLRNPMSVQDRSLWNSALDAAEALDSGGTPRLRMVDLSTIVESFDDVIPARDALVCRLDECFSRGISLSLENALVPWSLFRTILGAAVPSERTGDWTMPLCFDPCNLLLAEPGSWNDQWIHDAMTLPWSMLHLKQSRAGQVLAEFANGDTDWLAVWTRVGSFISETRIPCFWELASSRDLWQHLQRAEMNLASLVSRTIDHESN